MNGFTFVEGKGRHYGVPARDLTQDEFEALTPTEQRVVRESPAYKGKGGNPPKTDTPKAADIAAETKEGR